MFATDSSGAKVWEASYLPFGGVQTSTGPNAELRFPGQWFQSETGLHQNWMRDYDPTLGRYLQADPLGIAPGASVYGYALQSPMMYIDPNGENPLLIGAAIGLGLGLLSEFWEHGTNFKCYSLTDIAMSTAFGAFGGGLGNGLQRMGQARRAYNSALRAARNRGLTPRQAYDLRRNLGAQLKLETPQPIRGLIYLRNRMKYGDPLGPAWDPSRFSNAARTLRNTNSFANYAGYLPNRGLPGLGGLWGGSMSPSGQNQQGCMCGDW